MFRAFTNGRTLVQAGVFVGLAAIAFAGCSSGKSSRSDGTGGGTPGGTPAIANVQPSTGVISGGEQVTITITGATFGPNATASFAGSAATVNSNTSTALTVTTPAVSAAGPVEIAVTLNGPGSPVISLADGFVYQNFTVTQISPSSGPVGGGTSVVITGNGFPTDINSVSNLASFSVDSPTQISGVTAPSQSGTGAVNIVVTSPSLGTAVLQNAFAYTSGGTPAPPTLQVFAIAPNSGPAAGTTPAQLVTITGSGFSANPADMEVQFGGVAAVVTASTATQLTVEVPAATGAGAVDVVVRNTVDNSQGSVADAFSYYVAGAAPSVTAITPNTGIEAGGTQVVITGTNFLGADVAFVGSALLDFEVVNATTITGTIAALGTGAMAPTSVTVVVRNVIVDQTSGSTVILDSSEPVTFDYTGSLYIDRVDPNQGPIAGNTNVNIFGRNFLDGSNNPNVSQVLFGGVQATFNILNDGQINVTTPAGVNGPVAVTLVGQNEFPAQTVALRRSFTYGEAFDDPSLPGADTRDLAGDLYGDQNNGLPLQGIPMGANGQIALDGITSASRMASGDFTSVPGQYMAVTLPGTDQVYFSGGSIDVNLVNDGGECVRVETQALGDSIVALGGTPADVVWTFLNASRDVPDVAVALTNGALRVIQLPETPAFAGDSPMATVNVASTRGAPVSATGIGAGDFNNDGLQDLVTINGTTQLELFLNDGAGGYTPSLVTAAGVSPVRVEVADPGNGDPCGAIEDLALLDSLPKGRYLDINRDQNADIVLLNGDGSLSVMFGNGDATFSTVHYVTGQPLANAVDLVLTDINLDNRAEPAVLTNGNIAVFRTTVSNETNETSIAQIQTLTFPQGASMNLPLAITALDTNFDCAHDLVVSSFQAGGPQVVLYLSNRDGAFSPPSFYVGQVALNQDNALQIVDLAPSRFRSVWAASDVPSGVGANRKSVTQLDSNLITIFSGDAQSVLLPAVTAGLQPRAPRFGDMNDDGAMDLVSTSFADNTISVRLGNGNGTFGPASVYTTGAGPESLTLGDVDQDGDLDVIVCNNLNGAKLFDDVTVHLNTGNGTLGGGQSFSVGGRGPRDVHLADVNGDRDCDIIVANQTSNNVSVLFGQQGAQPSDQASSMFGAPSVYTVGNRPFALDVADVGTPEGANATTALQADGMMDIVVANSGDDTVTILYNGFMVGSVGTAGQFGGGENYPLGGAIAPHVNNYENNPMPAPVLTRSGVEPRDIVVRDLNGDSVKDIITVDQGTGTITILHANAYNRTLAPIVLGTSNELIGSMLGGGGAAGDGGRATGNQCNSLNVALSVPESPANSLVGVNDPGNIRKFFIPRDYRYNTGVNDIGNPPVVLPVGTTPQFLEVTDMNVDGDPDVVVGAFDGSITIYINAGALNQGTDMTSVQAPAGVCAPGGSGPGTGPGTPRFSIFPDVVPSAATAGSEGLVVGTGMGESFFASPRCTGQPHSAFTVNAGNPITGIDVSRVNDDCPPDIAVTLSDGTIVIYAGE